MVYVGLTDDYERRFIEHGKPHDWQCFGPFPSETQARAWEKGWAAQPGHAGGGGGAGWRYGYKYTITPFTRQ